MGNSRASWTYRRGAPRILAQTFCNEIVDGGDERHGVVVDLSPSGIRIERPYFGGRTPREVQLEFELPGIDEIIWARGDVAFDQLVPAAGGGIVRSTGLRLSTATARDQRMLRELVLDTYQPEPQELDVSFWLMDATSYLRG